MADLEAWLNELTRWGFHAVPRHFQGRVNALATVWSCTQAEAFGICLQAAEALLTEREGHRYQQLLRRRYCAPKTMDRRARIASNELPPLPPLLPPLGVGRSHTELRAIVLHQLGEARDPQLHRDPPPQQASAPLLPPPLRPVEDGPDVA